MRCEKQEKLIIITLALSAFITSFTGSALNVAIPDISNYFGVSSSGTGWIITGYTLAVALLSIPAGRLADKTGRKRILVAGLLIFTASSAASGLSLSFGMLLAGRIIQGAGAALIFSTNTAMLSDLFPQTERGRVLGYSLAATYLGLSAGPVLGGIINHNLGWRIIFAVTSFVSVTTLALSIMKIPGERPEADRNHADIRSLLKNRNFVCWNLAALLNYGSTFAASYVISVHLQTVAGFSSQTAGIILLAQPVVISILSPLAGKKSDSKEPQRLAAAGMAVCTAGIAAGVMIPRVESVFAVVGVLAAVGAGSALFSSPNTNAVMSGVPKGSYGAASSALSTMRALGNTLGMLAVTAISEIYMGGLTMKQAQDGQIIGTMLATFVIAGAACAIGIILSKRK